MDSRPTAPSRHAFFCLSLIVRFTRYSTATSPEPGQVVLHRKPGNLTNRPHVILRCHPLRMIQAPQRYLNSIPENFFVHGERTPTVRAEPSFRISRRPVSLRLPCNPDERIDGKVDETRTGSPGMLAAELTMADHAPDWRSGRSVPDCSTQTPTFEGISHRPRVAPAARQRSAAAAKPRRDAQDENQSAALGC